MAKGLGLARTSRGMRLSPCLASSVTSGLVNTCFLLQRPGLAHGVVDQAKLQARAASALQHAARAPRSKSNTQQEHESLFRADEIYTKHYVSSVWNLNDKVPSCAQQKQQRHTWGDGATLCDQWLPALSSSGVLAVDCASGGLLLACSFLALLLLTLAEQTTSRTRATAAIDPAMPNSTHDPCVRAIVTELDVNAWCHPAHSKHRNANRSQYPWHATRAHMNTRAVAHTPNPPHPTTRGGAKGAPAWPKPR